MQQQGPVACSLWLHSPAGLGTPLDTDSPRVLLLQTPTCAQQWPARTAVFAGESVTSMCWDQVLLRAATRWHSRPSDGQPFPGSQPGCSWCCNHAAWLPVVFGMGRQPHFLPQKIRVKNKSCRPASQGYMGRLQLNQAETEKETRPAPGVRLRMGPG